MNRLLVQWIKMTAGKWNYLTYKYPPVVLLGDTNANTAGIRATITNVKKSYAEVDSSWHAVDKAASYYLAIGFAE